MVGLDPSTQDVLRDLLIEAKRDGAAILLTTHQLAFARGVADRALLLADGAVIQQDPTTRSSRASTRTSGICTERRICGWDLH